MNTCVFILFHFGREKIRQRQFLEFISITPISEPDVFQVTWTVSQVHPRDIMRHQWPASRDVTSGGVM
jgi:hypothetical protein